MKAIVKKYSLSALLIPILGLLFLMSSCELADDVIGNATVAKIEGEWSCDETSEIFKSTSSVYSVSLSADPDKENGVIIDNFYGVNIAVKATVTGMTLIIGNQTTEDDYEVSGSGTISSNYEEINLNYNVDDGSGEIDHVTAVYTKID